MLQVFDTLADVVRSCLRRTLAYPLYRHWRLTLKVRDRRHNGASGRHVYLQYVGKRRVILAVQVLEDVVTILRIGRRAALSCLLDMRRILERDEYKRYHCRLYLDDYCVWLQRARYRTPKCYAVGHGDADVMKRPCAAGAWCLQRVHYA